MRAGWAALPTSEFSALHPGSPLQRPGPWSRPRAPHSCTSQDPPGLGARGKKAPPHTLQLPERPALTAPAQGPRASHNYTSQDPPGPHHAWEESFPSDTTTCRETRAHSAIEGEPQTPTLQRSTGASPRVGGTFPLTHYNSQRSSHAPR